jgi:protein phosphatase
MYQSGARTHEGMVRINNEDGYLAKPDSGIWAVADGMGGHDAGEVASATVIDALESIDRSTSAADLLGSVETALGQANRHLLNLAKSRGAVIGTTVAMLLVHQTYYACVWCGDSRIYRSRAGTLVQMSRDHTEVQQLVREGKLTPEEADNWPDRHVITRAVGVWDDLELETVSGVLEVGDIFVICSDGLTSHVADEEIRAILSTHQSQEACDALIALTLERGADDNVTAVVMRYYSDE